MSDGAKDSSDAAAPVFLAGGGAMGERIRAFDWAATPLGPPSTWPLPLRTVVRLLLSTQHPVFLFWGPDLRCIYNDAYSRSLGPEQHPWMLGRPGAEAWRGHVWDVIGPQIAQVMAGGESTWHENQLIPIARHGRRDDVYWTYSYSPVDDPQSPGGVGGALVLVTETTQQVLMQQRQAAAEARWRSRFDQVPGFVCILQGPLHVFEFVNPQYEALFPGTPLLGRSVAEALPFAAEQGFVALLDGVYRDGRSYRAESVPLSRPSGPALIVDFVYQPIRDEHGQVTGIFVMGNDVTAPHAAQEALRRSEESLRIACDAAELGFHAFDITSGAIEWDARVRALWGAGADETITFDVFEAGVHPDDVVAMTAAVQLSMDPAGNGRYEATYRVVHRHDGHTRWVRATGQTFFGEGRPLRLVGTVQDISAHKNAEAAKNQFLATLGHELRNPLAALRNAAALAEAVPADEDRRQWAQHVIKRQIAHMTRLVDDLVDVARIAYGRIELQPQPVLLTDVVQQALDVVRPALDQSGHRLALSLPSEPVQLHADPVRMAQVLANVLGNAVKYSAAGTDIELRAERSTAGGELLLRIKDQGIGLAASELEAVFQLFTQAEGGREQAQGGMGIGLSLARTLVQLHGGRIHARSEGHGRGAEFIIVLPLPAQPLPPPLPAPAPLPPAGQAARHPVDGCRVLVVDDNEDAARTLALLLEMEGAQVGLAFNGSDALARADALRPEILLLDIGLPDMSGHELCRQIRQRPWGARAIIVAQTGWGQEEDRQRSYDAGFDEHVVKPVQLEALARVLSTVRKLRAAARSSGGASGH